MPWSSFIDPDKPLRHVDVFLTKAHSYEEISGDAETISLAGRTIRIISAVRLLQIKRAIQPPRDKDCFDIKALERLLGKEAS